MKLKYVLFVSLLLGLSCYGDIDISRIFTMPHPASAEDPQKPRRLIAEFKADHANKLTNVGLFLGRTDESSLRLLFPYYGVGGIDFSGILFEKPYATLGEWNLFYEYKNGRWGLGRVILIQRSVVEGAPNAALRLTIEVSDYRVTGWYVTKYSYRKISGGFAADSVQYLARGGDSSVQLGACVVSGIVEPDFVGLVIPQSTYLEALKAEAGK